ncbi:hypothetical protein BGZ94_001285 [Podila epigama]|nr:hypothetical protein BGZ94_001285 [Podila epigama]
MTLSKSSSSENGTRKKIDHAEGGREACNPPESESGPVLALTPALLSPFYLPNPSPPPPPLPSGTTSTGTGTGANSTSGQDGLASSKSYQYIFRSSSSNSTHHSSGHASSLLPPFAEGSSEYDETIAPLRLRDRAQETRWDMDWRRHSRVYHDERWDRESILTVDSEMKRLSEDPSFPGYPERNAYWEQHCQIRERRQSQRHQEEHEQREKSEHGNNTGSGTKANATTGISCHNATSIEQDENEAEEYGQNDERQQRNRRRKSNKERLYQVTMLLHSASNPAAAARALAQQRQQQQQQLQQHTTSSMSSHCSGQYRHRYRSRYTSYSAYMAAMQLKARNRADRKRYSVDAIATRPPRDDLPRISPKLIEDVRALKERSLQQKAAQQPNFVQSMSGIFESIPSLTQLDSPNDTLVDGDEGKEGVVGCHDDGEPSDMMNGDTTATPAERIRAEYQRSRGYSSSSSSSSSSPRQQQHADSGILFVASTATTAKVVPNLNHDVSGLNHDSHQGPVQRTTTAPRIDYIQSAAQSTAISQLDGKGTSAGTTEQVRGGGNGNIRRGGGGGYGVERTGSSEGFKMLQSSFGEQGFFKRLNPNSAPPLSSCRVTRANSVIATTSTNTTSSRLLHPQRS